PTLRPPLPLLSLHDALPILTSPRNPRFALNIANRLWKRVMGVGLIEPVDSLSTLPLAEHAELIDFLTQTMIRQWEGREAIHRFEDRKSTRLNSSHGSISYAV